MKEAKRTPEDNQRAQLENEVARLKKKIEKYEAIELKQNRYGLVWLDVPEAFEDDVENKLPILEEVPKLAINSKDGKPTHLLIEGDNYHVLTCLNYTHKGKVDVIYIDPPYNTGSDGFKYKDKRILKEYPDGTEVPVEHPLRHSYWLSFMRKRLELARELLKEEGIIFISIDNHEFAQLKLLCDEILTENNFVEVFSWTKTSTPPGLSNKTRKTNEFILCYEKGKSNQKYYGEDLSGGDQPLLNRGNKARDIVFPKDKVVFKTDNTLFKKGVYERVELKDDLYIKGGLANKNFTLNGEFKWTQKTLDKEVKNGTTFVIKSDKFSIRFLRKDDKSYKSPANFIRDNIISPLINKNESDVGTNETATKELLEIFNKKVFDNPKPVSLIKYLLNFKQSNETIVLDFFAGSGTTGQAVMELNEKDNGSRQFILITNNDEITNGQKHKIMTDICYPRIKKVINGYNSKKALGNSIRYFKTAFVGKNNILNADDADKIELAHNAGGMLAIAENTFDKVEQNNYWQIFENEKQYTAVYFREEFGKFDNFIKKIKKLKKPAVVYIFSWEMEFEFNEFEDDKNIKVKTIPQPILEIYKQIYNLV